MKSDFTLAFNEILEARTLPKEKVLDALRQALVSAYRRDANVLDSQQVDAEINETGQPVVLVEKEVVDAVYSHYTEVSLEEARESNPQAQIGDMAMVPVRRLSSAFGRIAAQTAKQVILQHIREAERETLYSEFIEREGDLTVGTVQSAGSGTITLTLDSGRAEAIMPVQHRTPHERYRAHDKIRVYIAEVRRNNRGPQIIVSRNHKNMLRRLLEYEVPEIFNGQIEIRSIAREAGYRSKVAVAALQEGIDAVGACVGMRGMRIQNIVKELNNEKIDIIEWDADPERFIARALSPARVSKVFLEEEIDNVRTATVIVPEDQLSLAIGKEGQNARLAAKLTGWRIDIKSVVEAAQNAMSKIDEPPLASIQETHDELLAETFRILDKKSNNRVVTPEEYSTIKKFVELAESLLYYEREEGRQGRRDMIEAVRPLVPDAAFDMPLEELELASDIMHVIGRLTNIGELWVRFMADEDGLEKLLHDGGANTDSMDAIRDALDDLVIPEVVEEDEDSDSDPVIEETEPAEASIAPDIVETPEVVTESVPDVETTPEVIEEPPAPIEEPEAVATVADVISESDEASIEVKRKPRTRNDDDVQYEQYMDNISDDEFEDYIFDDDDSDDVKESKSTKKRGKNKKRTLVYDEDLGEVVAKRRRKRGRGGDYDEYDEYF